MIPNSDTLKDVKSVTDFNHLGIVVDNNDPKFLRRIKAKIPGIIDDENVNSLPWIYPYNCTKWGGNNEYGEVNIPKIGSKIIIKFPDKDIHSPYYIYSSVTEVPEEFKASYPNSYGFKDKSGNLLIIDETNNTVNFKHRSGFNFNIDSNGNWKIETMGTGYIKSDNIEIISKLLSNSGDIKDKKRTMQGDREIFNSHTHTTPHGVSSPPSSKE